MEIMNLKQGKERKWNLKFRIEMKVKNQVKEEIRMKWIQIQRVLILIVLSQTIKRKKLIRFLKIINQISKNKKAKRLKKKNLKVCRVLLKTHQKEKKLMKIKV